MRVRKYQTRDTDRMVSIWNEAVSACEPMPALERIDDMSGDAYFSSRSYCGVAVDFGANVHGFYTLTPDRSDDREGICAISIALAPSGKSQHADIDLIKDGITQAGRLGFKVLRFKRGADPEMGEDPYEKIGFKKESVISGSFVKNDGSASDICVYSIDL